MARIAQKMSTELGPFRERVQKYNNAKVSGKARIVAARMERRSDRIGGE
jgi:hypothetical protein